MASSIAALGQMKGEGRGPAGLPDSRAGAAISERVGQLWGWGRRKEINRQEYRKERWHVSFTDCEAAGPKLI